MQCIVNYFGEMGMGGFSNYENMISDLDEIKERCNSDNVPSTPDAFTRNSTKNSTRNRLRCYHNRVRCYHHRKRCYHNSLLCFLIPDAVKKEGGK